MWTCTYACTVILLFCVQTTVESKGLLLLYRPRDISNDCAFSHRLRYDISFGMGMSDTITLVFRTLNEIDYECAVEIVTESSAISIMFVVKYPHNLEVICAANHDSFTVVKKNKCLRLCDLLADRNIHTPLFVAAIAGRVRFRFLSNSSINTDLNANLYQVTATAARRKPRRGCNRRNETTCTYEDRDYCFTSGVVCDGITNCGVADWFDERKSDCGLPIEKLGLAPVVAVLAALMCLLLAVGHVLLRWLPPLANSFFIFNANEDNRLCLDPVFKSPGGTACSIETAKKLSLIPVSSSSSSAGVAEGTDTAARGPLAAAAESTKSTTVLPFEEEIPIARRKTTMRSMTEKIQRKLWSVRESKRNRSDV